MAEDRGKVGEAYVEFRGDTSQFSADVQKLKQETERAAADVSAATAAARPGLKGISSDIRESTAGINSLSRAISGLSSIVFRLIGFVGLLGSALVGLGRYFDGLAEKSSVAIGKTREMGDAIERLREMATGVVAAGLDEEQLKIVEATREAIEKIREAETDWDERARKIREVRELEADAFDRLSRLRSRAKDEAIALQRQVEANAISARVDVIFNSLLPEEAALKEMYQRVLDDWDRASVGFDSSERDRVRKRIEFARDEQLKAIKEVENERKRAEDEANRRRGEAFEEQARRSGEAFSRAIEQAFRQLDLSNTLRQNVTGPLLAELRDVALQLKINSMTGGRS